MISRDNMFTFEDSWLKEFRLSSNQAGEYLLMLIAPRTDSQPALVCSAPVAGLCSLLPPPRQRGGTRVRLALGMLSLAVCATIPASAQDGRESSPVPGEVRKIDEDRYIVGGVTLRKSTREITFDAQVNQTGGLIEFLLVTEKGKIHESLFSCAISPTDLNVAIKLLGYPSSPELFQIVTPGHRPTGKYPEVPEEVRNGARLAISVSWQHDGEEKTCAVNELVKNTATGEVMPPGPWLYTGSLITQTGFRAEGTGDIIAVFSNPAAMVNYPGEARTNDEVWWVKQDSLPTKGTPVRITIKPFSKSTQPIKPSGSP